MKIDIYVTSITHWIKNPRVIPSYDLRTLPPPSKRADHSIYRAYVSEHFKTEKKMYRGNFFRPISMKFFLSTKQTILRFFFLLFEKKMSQIFFFQIFFAGGLAPLSPRTPDRGYTPEPRMLLD